MNETLNQMLKVLTQIKHTHIENPQLNDDEFIFKYRGGYFYIIKSINMKNPDVGILEVYHHSKLPYSTKKDMINVPDFKISITKTSSIPRIEITNHLALNPTDPTPIDGMLRVMDEQNLPTDFVKQFEARMEKKDFKIYLRN